MLRELKPKRRQYWPHIGHLRLPTSSAPRSNKDQRGVRNAAVASFVCQVASTTPARCIVWTPPPAPWERDGHGATNIDCKRWDFTVASASSLWISDALTAWTRQPLTASSGRPRVPLVVLLILAVFWLWKKRVHFFLQCAFIFFFRSVKKWQD